MTVFKTILKIINKLKGMIFLYTFIIVTITVMNQSVMDKSVVDFSETKPDVVVVNNDNKLLSNDFYNYLSNHTNIKDIDYNDKSAIDDALFYRDINYVIVIPEGFNDSIVNGIDPKVEVMSSGDYNASYAEMLVTKYIKISLIYKDYYKDSELVEKINNVVDSELDTEIKTTLDTNSLTLASRYFSFMNYAFLAGCVYCISMVLASIKGEHINKRNVVSCYSYKKYNMIVLLANSLVVFTMWLIYMIIAFILFGDLLLSNIGLAFILNSLLYAFVSLTIGFLIGNITQNKNAIGGIINVVALGTSFLCGCFVPMEFMPNYVVQIAKVLPTYYFVNTNDMIRVTEVFNMTTIKPMLINAGILIGYSIFFIVLTNYISKKKQKLN